LATLSNHINQLNLKLQLLLKQYGTLISENTNQKVKIKRLEETVIQNKSVLEKLQQEQLILKASLDIMGEEEKKKLEKKINSYVRNIEKCISLLGHNQTV
jgi:septal ring factor EnvC (AmiA/AmiB activator)